MLNKLGGTQYMTYYNDPGEKDWEEWMERCETIWREQGFATSQRRSDRAKPRTALPISWAYALCHAA